MKHIGVFFGGRSAEHDISIVTALSSVIKPLEATNSYNVVPIYIAKDGRWYSDEKLKDIQLYQSGKIEKFISSETPISFRFDDGLVIERGGKKLKRKKQSTRIDIAFPAMHGTHGEDGELMGLLELANIPYVGCGVLSSAIAMDKVVCKTLIATHDIATPQMIATTAENYSHDTSSVLDSINKALKFPVFVKPARLGSSIGISKVESSDELQNAIEVALHYDNKVLVEEAVDNLIEVTVPVIGNHSPEPGLVEQPIVDPDASFDFDTKYLNQAGKGGKKMSDTQQGAQGYSKLPADISKKLYDASVATALASYKALECSGIARIDLLINNKSNTVYFNEINPLPGSLYRHNWHANGISAVELVTKLVSLAEEKHQEKSRLSTTFKTNFLKQF